VLAPGAHATTSTHFRHELSPAAQEPIEERGGATAAIQPQPDARAALPRPASLRLHRLQGGVAGWPAGRCAAPQGLRQDFPIVTGRHPYHFPPRLAPAAAHPAPLAALGLGSRGQRRPITIHPQEPLPKPVAGGAPLPLQLIPGDLL
jgi:hypothetical protein